jgi:hypothetical protein
MPPREVVRNSFELKTITPQSAAEWDAAAARFEKILGYAVAKSTFGTSLTEGGTEIAAFGFRRAGFQLQVFPFPFFRSASS